MEPRLRKLFTIDSETPLPPQAKWPSEQLPDARPRDFVTVAIGSGAGHQYGEVVDVVGSVVKVVLGEPYLPGFAHHDKEPGQWHSRGSRRWRKDDVGSEPSSG